MIYRPDYISAITPFIDKPLVKILAGVRRCGKSTIFEMLREELLRRGVPEDRISCEEDEFAATELLRFEPGSRVYMFYGTDSLSLAYKVREKVKKLAEEAAK